MYVKRKYSLRSITQAYWEVSYALEHPDAPPMTTQDAFKKLQIRDRLRPDSDWRLIELMHILTHDLIEGNQEWREKQPEQNTALILHMKDWTSTVPQRVQQSQTAML
jgi:hypothetical protein